MRHRGPNAEPQGALSAAMSPPPTSFESDEFGLEWSFIDDPESFVVGNADVQSSGAFLVSIDQTRPAVFEKDWNLDVSPAAITGEGINEVGEGQSLGGASDVYKDNDFLRLIRKGRQSTKQFAAVSDTRISIEYGPCRARAEEILENGYWEPGDLDELITCSRGNTNEDNLRANLMRTFESAGIRSSEGGNSPAEGLAHAWTDLDVNELALGLEATLSRATVLPGIGRFQVDKHREQLLLDALNKAKLLLQIEILGSEPAINKILLMVDGVLRGLLKPADVTTRQIVGDRDDAEATALQEAFARLRSWWAAGGIMEGKQRRSALHALEDLDLTFAFQRSLAGELATGHPRVGSSDRFANLILSYEAATNKLISEHLPFARRFASRNVGDEEELEDVVQVCALGLFGAARRFKPQRGHRFTVYSMFWMKQVLTRWRADEGSLVRIPVHRQFKLAELDLANLEIERRTGCSPSLESLSAALRWSHSDVERLSSIPREWVDLGPENGNLEGPSDDADPETTLYSMQISKIVEDALAELPQRQAEVLRMRFGLDGQEEMTLEEVGQLFGVTRERIRQVEAKALAYLSHPGRKRRLQAILGL
ncbi:sigma-70 family RNA polymerase sigma factor [Rhizobium leguminosarum]|nr:sigma-70 family RNA polymerase sigma factor [Rhizobium leguminosarum]